jgi:hypothetical protein
VLYRTATTIEMVVKDIPNYTVVGKLSERKTHIGWAVYTNNQKLSYITSTGKAEIAEFINRPFRV